MAQIATNMRLHVFKPWTPGDRPTSSRFSMVFVVPRTNYELVPEFNVALHASQAALTKY
jgi:hypothetical protein